MRRNAGADNAGAIAGGEMRVLVGCEKSGVVRNTFLALGHDAWSCDLEPSETEPNDRHLQCSVLDVLGDGWDLAIFHPPCTFIAPCQIFRKYEIGREDRAQKEEQAIEFATRLWEAPIPRICLENPKSVLSTRMAPFSQSIQPWQFGHP